MPPFFILKRLKKLKVIFVQKFMFYKIVAPKKDKPPVNSGIPGNSILLFG